MIIDEIMDEITTNTRDLEPETFPRYHDVFFSDNNKVKYATLYPDISLSFDDVVTVIGYITSDGSPLLSIVGGFLFKQEAGGTQVYFEDGLSTFSHTHNYTEFGYVMEGQFHVHFDDRDAIFNKGDIFLIDRSTIHKEYLYRRNSVVLLYIINKTFFDKTVHHDVYGSETENFIKNFVMGNNFGFVRFVPKRDNCQVPGLLEKILSEIWRPHPGTRHLVIGYVEWILNLIPTEYEIIVQRSDRNDAGTFLFEEIRRYLENNYKDVTLNDCIRQFGHNMNYFNRIIKTKTGMTFSAFVRNIKLEKAEFLLKTTDLLVEEIARQVGYENLTYFYKIFRKKYGLTPHNLRNREFSV